jgi:glyoxylase-like metal-dependent hydrolase (beta-lactamase superfamily II)/predicted ester cyclase
MVEAGTEAPAERRPRRSKAETERVARAYFGAVNAHDLEGAVAMWKPGGREHVRGQVDTTAPDGLREFLRELFEAFPDLEFEIVRTIADTQSCAVVWVMRGTFVGPGSLSGVAPTGDPVELEGVDVLRIDGGRILANDAYSDTIAEGVWLVRGGFPVKFMNVYLLRDGDGVMLFDAGTRSMVRQLATIGASMGGITRVLLGHSHPDHRGAAPGLGVPVLCHADERADAEGEGGVEYFDYSKLSAAGSVAYPRLLASWDGGPVTISATVADGDEIAGFRVVHIPGHAPGMIALWREADGLALTSDCFYTLDVQTLRKGHPRLPLSAFNADTERARESVRKLAALEPKSAWPGHADPLRGDVREQLERAAETT